MATDNSLFNTSGLAVGYHRDAPLFKNLDLNLKPAELVCLMGPNGAGKSTLIRTLAGLHPALHGSIPTRDEKHIAVVLTDKVSATHMTASELVALGRYPHIGWNIFLNDRDHQVIQDVVTRVRIVDLLERKLYELSDGQMQMVMIARALVQETPVLLLDEPTAHLDLNNRLEIMNLLRQLTRENGKAILVSTHELDLALQSADVVWLAANGSIRQGIPEDLVLDGSFDEVFQFKGFDLKTGKVQHTPFRNKTIQLVGDGHEYLWTKNALERNGFDIGKSSATTVSIIGLTWRVENHTFYTLQEVLTFLCR
jgi:iron complex transport system ATP-binding protein